MGSMIGSGIFIVSADIARQVESPGPADRHLAGRRPRSPSIAALSYGELAATMPQAGGQYVYLREAFGPLYGFLYGWTLFLVIQTGTIAAVAVAFAKFSGVFVPWISAQNYLVGSGKYRPHHAATAGHRRRRAADAVNTRGIRTGAIVQNIFTFAKTAALLGLVGARLSGGPQPGGRGRNFARFLAQRRLELRNIIRLVGVAMVGSLFSSDAWNNVTFTAGEVRNPQPQPAAVARARRGRSSRRSTSPATSST